MSGEIGGVEVAKIVITRRFMDVDGVVDQVDVVEATTPEGDRLVLTEALGMLRLAEDTLIREAMEDE